MKRSGLAIFYLAAVLIPALLVLSPPSHAGYWWNWFTKVDNTPGGKAAPIVRAVRSLSLIAFNRDNFDPKKVRLLDHIGNNVILRMPNPAIDGAFCEQAFYKAIKDHLPSGLTLESSKIIAFNLMYPYMEGEEYTVEKNWFEAHPEHEFRNYPQLGGILNAAVLPNPVRSQLKERHNFLFQPTNKIVDDLRTEITTASPDGRPKIIVLHCVSGRDRTGAIAGQYRMRYQRKSYADVVRENQFIAGKAQDVYSRIALRWMALKLLTDHPTIGTEAEVLALDDKDISWLPGAGVIPTSSGKGG